MFGVRSRFLNSSLYKFKKCYKLKSINYKLTQRNFFSFVSESKITADIGEKITWRKNKSYTAIAVIGLGGCLLYKICSDDKSSIILERNFDQFKLIILKDNLEKSKEYFEMFGIFIKQSNDVNKNVDPKSMRAREKILNEFGVDLLSNIFIKNNDENIILNDVEKLLLKNIILDLVAYNITVGRTAIASYLLDQNLVTKMEMSVFINKSSKKKYQYEKYMDFQTLKFLESYSMIELCNFDFLSKFPDETLLNLWLQISRKSIYVQRNQIIKKLMEEWFFVLDIRTFKNIINHLINENIVELDLTFSFDNIKRLDGNENSIYEKLRFLEYRKIKIKHPEELINMINCCILVTDYYDFHKEYTKIRDFINSFLESQEGIFTLEECKNIILIMEYNKRMNTKILPEVKNKLMKFISENGNF